MFITNFDRNQHVNRLVLSISNVYNIREPFIQIRVRKFETIIQNPCSEEFDEGHFVLK